MSVAITISNPETTSSWITGQTMNIQWSPFFTTGDDYTQITLYKGSTADENFVGQIAADYLTSGSYRWTIPLWDAETLPTANDYIIQVYSVHYHPSSVNGIGETGKFSITRSGGGTTTTTTTPSRSGSTVTTTTRPPLLSVKTLLFKESNGQFVEAEFTDASDDISTKNRPFAQSLNFGTLAPGETSDTMVIALNIPYVKGIKNVRLGLTNTGGLAFTNTTFGINSSIELRSDITPDNNFLGVNTHEPTPIDTDYTIAIDNRDKYNSAYVYLNVKLPLNQNIGFGIIGFKWYFDYAD